MTKRAEMYFQSSSQAGLGATYTDVYGRGPEVVHSDMCDLAHTDFFFLMLIYCQHENIGRFYFKIQSSGFS